MILLVLIVLLPGAYLALSTTEYNATSDDFSNATEYSTFNLTDGSSEGVSEVTQDSPLRQYQDINNLRIYKGPLPKFPGTTASPWIALHSPVKMYIPIRNTGKSTEESEDCVHCPRNMIVYLHRQQRYILTPVPTISICSSFAHRAGRVHVAVVSGPRPGQRLYSGHYQVELMVWKAEGPVHSCNYTILVKMKRQAKVPKLPKNIFCTHPKQPSNGFMACDPSGRKLYPPNSVCQLFCEGNYLIKNSTRNSSTIVCKNGRWSPESNVTCVATFCPDLPKLAAHSYWNCDLDDSSQRFLRGTRCQVNCASGYVVPSSKSNNDIAVCTPPSWNISMHISECTKASPPKLVQCQNRHVIVRKGQSAKMSETLLPKGTSHTGIPLTPVCSIQGKMLSKGKHQIICEVEDPELNTRRECSYRIHVEESSGPFPHIGDCKNRTVLANRKGIIRSKPVRFLVKVGQPERTKVLRGKCKPEGNLGVGNHFIACKATDPPTGATGTCSYWLKIQKRSCKPLQKIPNGHALCPSHDIGAVCQYECDEGYYIPGNHFARSSKTCHSNQRWYPPLNPTCKIKEPELLEGCDNLEIELSAADNFTVPLPRFLTALNETLNTSCEPSSVSTPDVHQITCSNDDDLYNVSCIFNVSISLKQELTTVTEVPIPEGSIPELIKGCNDLEVNASAPVYFSVPVPIYLTASNETLNVSCVPFLLETSGKHRIFCTPDDDNFNVSCQFNVTVLLEEESTTEQVLDTGNFPELIKGCNDIEVNASGPVYFSVPVPIYLTASNETLDVSCVPFLLEASGKHRIFCTPDDGNFNVSCQFNVTVLLEEESTSEEILDTGSIPELIEGCNDLEVNVSAPVHFLVPIPFYLTASNETLNVSCVPFLIEKSGKHQIVCSADDSNLNVSCHFNATVLLKEESTTEEITDIGFCKSLSLPEHSTMQCTTEKQTQTCQVTCDQGYGFPEEDSIIAKCVRNLEGLWDFQKFNANETLPDCLAQMEGSAVEVWMSFEAFAPHCEDELQEQLRDLMIGELCEVGTDCTKIEINCTLDEESDMMLVAINWTVQADFNDEDYYDDEEIPEAEIRLEAVMEKTRMFLATEEAPEGMQLFRDSFRRGHFTLVCPKGFTPNILRARCVECTSMKMQC